MQDTQSSLKQTLLFKWSYKPINLPSVLVPLMSHIQYGSSIFNGFSICLAHVQSSLLNIDNKVACRRFIHFVTLSHDKTIVYCETKGELLGNGYRSHSWLWDSDRNIYIKGLLFTIAFVIVSSLKSRGGLGTEYISFRGKHSTLKHQAH